MGGTMHTSTYRTATYTGRGEFYSGIRTGERVIVETTTWQPSGTVDISIQSIENPGPWLSVRNTATELADISEDAVGAGPASTVYTVENRAGALSVHHRDCHLAVSARRSGHGEDMTITDDQLASMKAAGVTVHPCTHLEGR